MDGIRGLVLSTFVCILTIILAGAPRAFAQGQNAILTGTIADNDGVIPGAMVIVTDPATGLTRSAEPVRFAFETTRKLGNEIDLKADWEGIERAPNEALVNALAMMSPYGTAEKQALLEAPDLKTRAEVLIAITEIELAKKNTEGEPQLQ